VARSWDSKEITETQSESKLRPEKKIMVTGTEDKFQRGNKSNGRVRSRKIGT
jgi:hypothetical protein